MGHRDCDDRQVVDYESIKRELKIKPIYECRCDERLKTKAEESARLAYMGCWFNLLRGSVVGFWEAV
jgi:hypothetical protein